ncbi:leucine-rich repeat protein [Tessaracoccus sp. SD287]|uniref:FG-GAP-like repeat-containing protein n=1 Tax=Tessaracoccus sp. SD287 TaxID=2782008 RepID=UPI001A97AF8F|nr:FG-GAP-like repeat-containing protein [Tessaracoccus sp. SD287]MBO1030479.1 leucine-rich repeat protein [Tessaracoccus sp. SD287]
MSPAIADARVLPREANSPIITIDDPGLRVCLSANLALLPGTPLRAADLGNVRSLLCDRADTIRDLSELEHAPNLVNLQVYWQNLGAVTLPANLTALESVDLYGNKMTSLVIPPTLTSLRRIEATGNQLSSLTIPETLVSLAYVDLTWNELTSFSPPETLTSLTTLFLDQNRITSLTLPDTLTRLQSVHATSNLLPNLVVPESLTELRSLELGSNRLTDFTVPSTATKLWRLGLAENRLSSLMVPAELVDLEILKLHENQLSNLSLPGSLVKLQYLNIATNQLTTVHVPDTLTALYYVELIENQLADLSGLAWASPGIVRAERQRLVLPAAEVGVPYRINVLDEAGKPVVVTAPTHVTASGSLLNYSQPGTYEVPFSGSRAGHYDGIIVQKALQTTPAPASGVFGDHTGDGIGDLFAVDGAGQLIFHRGSAKAPASEVGVVGTGWGSMTYLAQIDDLTGDRRSDLLARRGTDHSLWLYRSVGGGSVAAWKQMGSNWGGMDQIVPAGNLAGGSTQYVVARRASDGALFRYTVTANGLTDIKHIGKNWNGMTQILSVGDVSLDGRSDILAIRSDGMLWSYLGTSNGGIGPATRVGRGWEGFTRAFSAGDLSGDGVRDLVGQRKDGVVFIYENKHGYWGVPTAIMTAPADYQLMA